MADKSKLYDHPRSAKKDDDEDDIKIGDIRKGRDLGYKNDDGEYEYLGHDPDSEAAVREPKRRGDRNAHDDASRAHKKWDEGEQKKRAEGKDWGMEHNPAPAVYDYTSKPTRGTWRRRGTPTS